MKRLVILTVAALALQMVGADGQVSLQLSLGESIRLAIGNSAQIEKAKIDRHILERKVKEARSEGFPQITTLVNMEWWPVLPTQLLPGELFNQSEGSYQALQFGRPWQLAGHVVLEQNLINEAAKRSVPALKTSRGISELLIERAEFDVIFNTASVFYQILQAEQLLRAIDANIGKMEALQGMAELQLANGYAVPTDVKRIRVAKTNLSTQRQNLLTGISSLRQTLQFLCGLPLGEPLNLTDETGLPGADSMRWLGLTLDPRATNEHRLVEHQKDLLLIQRRSAIAEALPSMNAYASLSAQTFRSDINFFDLDRRWYGAAGAGVRLKIPIFDGFRVHNKAKIFKLEEDKLEEDRRQLESAKALEFRQAQEQFRASLQALRTQSDNVALAKEITDKLLLQYKEGVAPLTDLLNAQTALSEAETYYWQQVFSYKLAVLKLLKAAGQLELLKVPSQ